MSKEIDAANALREVAPPDLPALLLAYAKRTARGPVAIYVIDVDGSCFLRLVGGEASRSRSRARTRWARSSRSRRLPTPASPPPRRFPAQSSYRSRAFAVSERLLASGDRLFLYSDGITERRDHEGAPLGLDAIEAALRPLAAASAAHIVSATQDAVRSASSRPLSDDATLLILGLDG